MATLLLQVWLIQHTRDIQPMLSYPIKACIYIVIFIHYKPRIALAILDL